MRAGFALPGPHPGPLDSGSKLRSTSSIHGVVPQGEGEKRHALFCDRISNWMTAILAAGVIGFVFYPGGMKLLATPWTP